MSRTVIKIKMVYMIEKLVSVYLILVMKKQFNEVILDLKYYKNTTRMNKTL